MARAKYRHCGKGPAVRDNRGWILGPGDEPISLPPGADATVLAAVRNKTLIRADEKPEPAKKQKTAKKPEPEKKPESPKKNDKPKE